MQGIFTILRDKSTSREDFIFFTDRLSTYLSEKAMEFLPFKNKRITTPIDSTYAGKALSVDVCTLSFPSRVHGFQSSIQHVCGISILRS